MKREHERRVVKAVRTACSRGAAVFALLLVAACALPGQKPSKPTVVYLLEADAASTRATGVSEPPCLTLSIAMPRSAPGFATSRIAYVEQPYRIDYFAYHEWADTPARMLQSVLQQTLEASRMFRAVVAGSMLGIQPDLRLETDLIRLQQEFLSSESQVQLDVGFSLHDVAAHRLLFSESFSLREPASENNPYAGVVAANRAVGRSLDALLEAVEDAVRQVGCTKAVGVSEE